MILQCSECQARFLVPDQVIGAKGRNVRCGKCAHTWFQELPAESAKELPQLPDLDVLLDEINTRPKPIAKGSNLPKLVRNPKALLRKIPILGAALAAAALAVLLAAPGLLGQPHSKGLALADVGIVKQVMDDKHLAFQINGKIANMSESNAKTPTLRVTLVDAEGSSLQYWDFPSDGAMIEPGKNIPFATGSLDIRNNKGTRFVVELGNSLELLLRRKPG